MLSLRKINKSYGDFVANKDISFDVPSASIFGLLGPNGAGKTTLIRIITGITRPDTGEVFINGKTFTTEDRLSIGYMPEERGLYKKMKVGEQLVYLAQLKGLRKPEAQRRILQWMEKLEIGHWYNKKIEELSKGMQQKIQFISTVAHEPKLIILDEPFSGLDPINAEVLIREIHLLRENGATLIFSTHRMEQVEELCQRIVLINCGHNILEGNVTELRRQFKENVYHIELEGTEYWPLPDGVCDIRRKEGNNWWIQLREGQDVNQILSSLIAAKIRIINFHEVLPSLNEIFIRQVKDFTS